MSRLATRKATRKISGTKRKFASFKNSRKAKNVSPQNKAYISTIDNFLNNIRTVAKKQAYYKNANPAVARRLTVSATGAKGQLRKTNVVNPNLGRHLNNIRYSLRSAKNVSPSVRGQLPRIYRHLREGVKKDVLFFLGTLNREIHAMTYDLTKWETALTRKYASVKAGKKRYKIDPSIKRRFVSIETRWATFKTKWGKLLTSLATYGHGQVKSSVRMIKKEFERLQKVIRADKTLVRSIVRLSASKKFGRTPYQYLITKAEWNKFYRKWSKKYENCQKWRKDVVAHRDQLRAIKVFK